MRSAPVATSLTRTAPAFRGRKLSATSARAQDGFARWAAISSGEFERMMASRNPSRCTTRSSRSRSEMPKEHPERIGSIGEDE